MGKARCAGRKRQRMGCSGVDCGTGDGQEERSAFVPSGPLIHEPRAGGVAGLAENDVQGGVVKVGEIGRETLGRAEAAAYLLDRGGVAALRLRAGSGGSTNQVFEQRRLREEGVLDIYGMGLAVLPFREVGRSMGFRETIADSCC